MNTRPIIFLMGDKEQCIMMYFNNMVILSLVLESLL